MKKSKTAILSLGVLTLALVLATPTLTRATSSITHPDHSVKYQENPTPRLVGNTQADPGTFMTKEQAIGQAHLSQDAKLTSAKLTTWGQHVHEDLQDQGPLSGEIAKDRMVWVLKVDYPNGKDTKAGFYGNAKQVMAFDAESGQIMNVITTGHRTKTHKQFVNAPQTK